MYRGRGAYMNMMAMVRMTVFPYILLSSAAKQVVSLPHLSLYILQHRREAMKHLWSVE
jgi:hypothetical protein